jgi:hypothetical protein
MQLGSRPKAPPEMPGVEFRGTVARVASALQPGTRTLLTEIDVPNHEGLLAGTQGVAQCRNLCTQMQRAHANGDRA